MAVNCESSQITLLPTGGSKSLPVLLDPVPDAARDERLHGMAGENLAPMPGL